MNKTETQHIWTKFLETFSRQNHNRPTRLGVFEGEPGAMTDFWLEDGLPLGGIDLDSRGEAAPVIEIMLWDREKKDARHFTHTITKARSVKIILSSSGESDGLDIEDENGAMTILRFENKN
ncbi:MAG TPA: DUF5335 family protein [Pyrinomonadaceae bacterium]|nr:DUF5335 family protein [Pyrinomonadaceae bacterium]